MKKNVKNLIPFFYDFLNLHKKYDEIGKLAEYYKIGMCWVLKGQQEPDPTEKIHNFELILGFWSKNCLR